MRISDWSSDVCSSDLTEQEHRHRRGEPRLALRQAGIGRDALDHPPVGVAKLHDEQEGADRRDDIDEQKGQHRSEERRVGKECVSKGRSRWSLYRKQQKIDKYHTIPSTSNKKDN